MNGKTGVVSFKSAVLETKNAGERVVLTYCIRWR